MALFEAGNTEIYTRLLEGEYINYKNLLPADCATSVKVETNMLKDSLERASILAREGNNNVVKFEISEKNLEITSNSEMGNIDEQIPVITAVSYTHLDVYKRQEQLFPGNRAARQERDPVLFIHVIAGKMCIRDRPASDL